MAIEVRGFGRRIERDGIPLADLFILSHGASAVLAMRVGEEFGQPHDLLLAPLRGEADPAIRYPREAPMGRGDYTAIDGQVIARPTSFPVPNDDAPGGTLVVDSEGGTFIRLVLDGVDYYDLSTGRRRSPKGNRAYYTDWELVQVIGPKQEWVIARMARTGPPS